MTASSASSGIPKMSRMVFSSRNLRAVGDSCGSRSADMIASFWRVLFRDEEASAARARGCAQKITQDKKNPGGRPPTGVETSSEREGLSREDAIQLLFDLHFLRLRRDRDLLDQQRARRVQHLALAERQFLVTLEPLQIAQHLGDLEDRAGLDLLHVLAVAAVPGLALDRDLAALQNREHLVHLVGANELTQTDRARIARRDHDLHPVLEDLENVKGLLVTGDLTRLDTDNLRHTVSRINGQVTHSERRLHD